MAVFDESRDIGEEVRREINRCKRLLSRAKAAKEKLCGVSELTMKELDAVLPPIRCARQRNRERRVKRERRC